MLFIPNSSKLWLCLAPRNKCELSPPLPPSQAAGDIAPPAPGDRRGKSPTRKHPEGMAGDGSFVFSPSVKDVKPGNGPAASICKHVVNDPISRASVHGALANIADRVRAARTVEAGGHSLAAT